MMRGTRLGTAVFVVSLARPYRAGLVLILLAMLVETLATLALPWPLKVVIDSVIGGAPPFTLGGLAGGPGGGR